MYDGPAAAKLPAMPRFLIAALPFDGQPSPLLRLARELDARGHAVLVYSSSDQRAAVEAAGCAFLPPLDGGRAEDLARHVANAQPDMLVADSACAPAAAAVHGRCGQPWATFGGVPGSADLLERLAYEASAGAAAAPDRTGASV
jgi:hypothetical protein